MIKINIDKGKLKELYVNERLSSIKCALVFNCCIATIIKRLREYNIPVRSIGEANKGNIGYWTGKYHSEETKQKISEKHKGQIAWNKGLKGCYTLSIKTRKKMSESLIRWYKGVSEETKRKRIKEITNPSIETRKKLSESRIGGKHPNWKGGISPINYEIRQSGKYKEWRNDIYKRDKYNCQICGKHCGTKDIIAHHKKSFSEYPELRFNINNGITLCRNCHAKIHNYNGSFIPKGELAICL